MQNTTDYKGPCKGRRDRATSLARYQITFVYAGWLPNYARVMLGASVAIFTDDDAAFNATSMLRPSAVWLRWCKYGMTKFASSPP